MIKMRIIKSVNCGVSVIECIVTLLVLAVLAISAIPRIGVYNTLKLDAATRKVASDLRYAQTLAMTMDGVEVVVYSIGNSYSVYQNFTSGVFARDPLQETTNLIVDFTKGQYQGITVNVSLQGADGMNRAGLWFQTRSGMPYACSGTTSNPANYSILSIGTITLSYRGMTRTINITPRVGRICIGNCP